MNGFNFILLDWDGCLAKTLDIWMHAYKKIFKDFGFQFSEEEIVKIFGDWEGPKKIGVKDNKTFIKNLVTEVNLKLPYVELYSGVRETLTKLKNLGKKIAVITSSKKTLIFPALKNLQLENFFDVLLTEEDVVKHKPDPEIVDKSMSLLKAIKTETIIVGDSQKDILAGQAAGITTALFFPKENERFYKLSELMAYKPDNVFKDFSELSTI